MSCVTRKGTPAHILEGKNVQFSLSEFQFGLQRILRDVQHLMRYRERGHECFEVERCGMERILALVRRERFSTVIARTRHSKTLRVLLTSAQEGRFGVQPA